MPLRQAYQTPDTFRTPNPTPLEQRFTQRAVLSAADARPERAAAAAADQAAGRIPPLAPLVNVRVSNTWLPAGANQLGWDDFDVRGRSR